MSEEIDNAYSKLQVLGAEFDEIYRRKRKIELEMYAQQRVLAALVFGLEEGIIVRGRRDRKLYRVVRWDGVQSKDPSYYKPLVYANPMKKDGSYGIAERNLYGDWEHLAPMAGIPRGEP